MRQLAHGYRAQRVKLILESSILQILLMLFFSVHISAAAQLKHTADSVSERLLWLSLCPYRLSGLVHIFHSVGADLT